ncbi:MAG: hypothetical protein NTX67_08355, partial [Burkholderiales bacterium]|nr:hypothetical protein [Burkholderiales bacterium]
KHHHGVLSTGGGAVLRPVNRQNLHARGKVVYLRSTPEEVFRRLRHDMQRPLLQVNDPQSCLSMAMTRTTLTTIQADHERFAHAH